MILTANRKRVLSGGGGGTPSYVAKMVASYRLEADSTDSLASNDGTDANISYVSGYVNNGAEFNGTNSQIYAQYSTFDFFGSQKFSYVACIKLDALPAASNIIHPLMIQNGTSAGTYDKGFRIYDDGMIGFYAYDGAAKHANSAAGVISTATWYVLTAVFDGSQLEIFVDNVSKGTVACSGSFNHANPRLVWSHSNTATIEYVDGIIDEVSIFDDELTSGERLSIYNTLSGGNSLDVS